ncbi:MAG: hypothetical protein IRZ08_21100, partial [Frankia sp.]|nr:hypothetical protein [Frankia sp.]
MATPDGGPGGVSGSVIWRGLKILGIPVREEPRLFAISVAGSALFGLTTVGASYVLGQATDRVVLPSLRDGDAAWGAVVGAPRARGGGGGGPAPRGLGRPD